MQPRSWVVERVAARRRAAGAVIVAACMALVSSCGQARVAAPPDPLFTSGPPADTTAPTPSTGPPVTAEEPDLSAIEADAAPGDVDRMLLVDDAGVATPNEAGWAVFDDSLSRRLIPGDVSASVAVMIDGTIVHQAAFGERIAGSGEAVDVTDRFRIGSVSKVLTAIVTLQLVEQGELTLDEPVGQVLVDHLHLIGVDPDVPNITVRELLSHTAGFPDHQGTVFGNGATSYTDALRIGLTSSVTGPGSYNYANMGYIALTVLIEAVTGRPYEEVVREQLLEPLGITGMRMTGTFELGPDEVSHHPLAGRNYMEVLGGAGAWNATPADLVRIVNAIDPATPGWKALSPETLAVMRYRVPVPQPPQAYGLGLINYPGDSWGHTGTIEHTHAMVLVQPDGVTWAVTVSGDVPSETGALRSIVTSALSRAFPG